jgi:Rieske Fe-S protein
MEQKQNGRRRFIKQAGIAGAACLFSGALAACSEPEKPMGTRSELEAQGFLMVRFNGSRAHARYIDGELVVFSQICQHKKCTVRWDEAENKFYCPCHEGIYDADGNVISGPPEGPLRRLKYEWRGDSLIVLNQFL